MKEQKMNNKILKSARDVLSLITNILTSTISTLSHS